MFSGKNLPHELLLTTSQKTKLKNALEKNMSTDIKICKTQISKIIQSGGFLGSLLSKLADPLMTVAVPIAKNILAPLGITAAASEFIQELMYERTWLRKEHGYGRTTLIISNEEMNDIMEIVQALEDSNILLKETTKTIQHETKKEKDDS